MRVRSPALSMAVGLGVLGVTSYGFLLIAGQALGDEKYAAVGALWLLSFLIGPGFFYPVEQELARAIAARRVLGRGSGPVIRKALTFTLVLLAVIVVTLLTFRQLITDQLFGGSTVLFACLCLTVAGMAVAYVMRGVLSGNQELHAYGLVMSVEGLSRFVAAAVLIAIGIKTMDSYGWLIALAPVAGVLAVVKGKRKFIDHGPPSSMREVTFSLGNLVGASLFAQVLANAAPLVVTYLASPAQAGIAGAFTKAVVICRIPLFLFQALQAVMLPRLSALAAEQKYGEFRSAFGRMMVLVVLIGAAGTVGAAVAGPLLLDWFGSDSGLPRTDIVLLAVGSAVYLLAMATAQGLVALEAHRDTVVGWIVGVAVFATGIALPWSLIRGTEIALLAGSLAAFVAMGALLIRRLAGASRPSAVTSES